MSILTNIPAAKIKTPDGLDGNAVALMNLPPTSATVSRNVSTAGTLAQLLGTNAGSLVVTLTTEKMFHFIAGQSYPIVWRWRQSGDSNGITVSGGAYPYDDEISAGNGTWRAIPDGVTSVIIDYLTVSPAITVIGK